MMSSTYRCPCCSPMCFFWQGSGCTKKCSRCCSHHKSGEPLKIRMELHFTAVPSGISIKNRTEIWFLQIHPEFLSKTGQKDAALIICPIIGLDSGQKYSFFKSIRNTYQKPDRKLRPR